MQLLTGFIFFWIALTIGLRWGLRESSDSGKTYGPPKAWRDCVWWAFLGTIGAHMIWAFVSKTGHM